jgi:ribose transport system permease protein
MTGTRALRAVRLLERSFLVLVTGALVILFWRLSPGWLNSQTVPFIIAQNAPLEVLAVGMTFSMISSNIDLSPGSMLSLAAMVTGLVIESTGSLWLGLLTALGLTLSVGVISGYLVGRLQISAIIVTLATYIWAAGLATAINGANAIPIAGSMFKYLNDGVDGWTWTILVVLVFVVAGQFLLHSTKFGYYSRAIGRSGEFARRTGVPVVRYTVCVFVFMGLSIWLATLLSISQLGAAQSSAGVGLELDAIVAVVIGGTRLTGGEGSVLRSGLGALVLAVLSNGLSSLGLSDAYYDLWEGLALIAVLVVSVLLQRLVVRLEARRQVEHKRTSAPDLALQAA